MEVDPQEPFIDLLDFPELVSDCLFSKLSTVDIARLRLTSKEIKAWATQYLKRKKCFLRVKINDTEGSPFTLKSAKELSLNLGIPIRELSVQISSKTFYSDEEIEDFLSHCGTGVKKLKIYEYFPDCTSQLKFLDRLPNVEELKICYINATGYSGANFKRLKITRLPSFFEYLKVLKFGCIDLIIMDTDFWIPMIMGAPRLNYLRYPFCCTDVEQFGVNQQDKYDCFRAIFKNQRERFPDEPSYWLQSVDFKNLDESDYIQHDGFDMLFFLDDIKNMDIKLLNVNSEYFENVEDPAMPLEFHSAVKSLILTMDVPILPILAAESLEIVKIPSLHEALSSEWTTMDMIELVWPNVKSLQIHFDIPLHMTELRALKYLLGSFFPDSGMTKTEELDISFDEDLAQELVKNRCGSILSARRLARGSPMLKKLTLSRWNPVNSGFVRLWRELPFLEELRLANCPSLGNVSLIGENLDSPAFLELPYIKKLTLVLDECPRLTDRAFKDVFRHLKLKEFTIISSKPLTTITKTGINWLLDGVFSTTILKFPFHTWSSVHIPAEEMPLLKSQFKTLIY